MLFYEPILAILFYTKECQTILYYTTLWFEVDCNPDNVFSQKNKIQATGKIF